MALITPQTVPVTGLVNPTLAAASGGGDTIAAAPGLMLVVRNADASPHTATLVRPGSQYGQANPDVAIVVGAGQTAYAYVPPEFADPTDGLIDVTYSAVTSVTVGVFRF